MNEELTKKLIRQLKFINFWLAFFGSLFLIALVTLGILAWNITQSINSTREEISSIKTSTTEQLDVSSKLCNGTGVTSDLLRANTDICK